MWSPGWSFEHFTLKFLNTQGKKSPSVDGTTLLIVDRVNSTNNRET